MGGVFSPPVYALRWKKSIRRLTARICGFIMKGIFGEGAEAFMDRWLKRSVLSEFSRVPGRSGLYYKNLATGEEFGVRQDEAFLAASVIKLPVFAAVASLAEQGEARWDEKLKARREERVPPCGALWFFRDEPEVRLDTLCELMITLSDNMATNLILRRFGLEMLNECFRALGLRTTHLERVLFDAQAAAQGRENVFSPREMGALLEGVHARTLLRPETCEYMEEVLLQQQINHKIPGYLCDEFPVLHKTGEDDGVTNDVALVEAAQPFVLCGAFNETDVPTAERFLRRAGQALCRAPQK